MFLKSDADSLKRLLWLSVEKEYFKSQPQNFEGLSDGVCDDI